MTAPEPLARVTVNPFAKALLESAREDHSASGAAQRALGALGLAGTSAALAQSSALGVAKASSTVGVQVLAGKGLVVAAQFMLLGLLGGVAVVGSAAYVFTPRAAVRLERRVPAAQNVPVGPALAAPGKPVVTAPARFAPAPASVPRSHEAVPAKSAGPEGYDELPSAAAFPTPTGVSTEAVDAQLAELRVIRGRLNTPNAALTLLDSFEQRHPATPLAEEAGVLRIEALVNAGRKSEATALGTAFLRQTPHSAYAQRVRSKLEQP
ncbi:MAG: hypothetical protein ABI627_00100 [Polyangiaceae bacterium]